ncbi:mobilization protein [Agrobacterium tumefaciens]|uniref:mobilization protein n=1 Tax=Agrobacterium tumefaciens TaxID=358 RepID=UPI0013AFBDAE|nr:mobilization protein [Agrobacterium tumefaciens]
MARKTIEQRLAELEAQRSALKARLSKTERNNDMRRKVLIGSLVLHHLETSDDQVFKQQLGEWLRRELPGFLTRDNDKALFADLIEQGLPGTADSGDSTQGTP